jgi:hypothetical protein
MLAGNGFGLYKIQTSKQGLFAKLTIPTETGFNLLTWLPFVSIFDLVGRWFLYDKDEWWQ